MDSENVIKNLELLSPAKNPEYGIAAINCGADAVYIGPPKFGARIAAGNTLKGIETLVNYAHKYWARVYVTINTLIYDDEFDEVQSLINKLYEIGIDAVIIQDFGILQLNLPPIPLIASTQMHNNTFEKVKFLEETGFRRVILARELSLKEIHSIKKNTNIELECFVHGALCVSYSGQCYFSQALFNRSGNRGECAQPCRMLYSLEDSSGRTIIKDKYLLSLKDLNLSSYINELILAGVTSFKIEGRLKDINYVKNITAFYRQSIDRLIEKDNSLSRSSSGKVFLPFMPDPERTFNRGYTTYFLNGKNDDLASFDTQKSTGKYAGRVKEISGNFFLLEGIESLKNGDGLCFINKAGVLCGMNVIKAEGEKVYVNNTEDLFEGAKIFRNREIEFNKELNKKGLKRQVAINYYLYEQNKDLYFSCHDENGNTTEIRAGIFDVAENQQAAKDTIIKQLSKSGETIFYVNEVIFQLSNVQFIPVGKLNEIRRNLLEQLVIIRLNNFPRWQTCIKKHNSPYPIKQLDYRGNVVNKNAAEFYREHGTEIIENGFETLKNASDKTILISRYCIKYQIGICPKVLSSGQKQNLNEPLFLIRNNKKYIISFDCKNCVMLIKG